MQLLVTHDVVSTIDGVQTKVAKGTILTPKYYAHLVSAQQYEIEAEGYAGLLYISIAYVQFLFPDPDYLIEHNTRQAVAQYQAQITRDLDQLTDETFHCDPMVLRDHLVDILHGQQLLTHLITQLLTHYPVPSRPAIGETK